MSAPVSFALVAGAVAAFNPCGFAMLPAYISMFLNADGERVRSIPPRLLAAARLGLATTIGFVAVFLPLGLAFSTVAEIVAEIGPWLILITGVVLVVYGLLLLTGRASSIGLRWGGRVSRGRGFATLIGFGASYAAVSLSCTLPVFTSAVATTLRRGDLLRGISVFMAYALGMGLVFVALALLVTFAQARAVQRLRRVAAIVHRVSGVLLTTAGGYLAYLGWYEWQISNGDRTSRGPIPWVQNWSRDLQSTVRDLGASRLPIIATALIGGLAVLYLIATNHPPNEPDCCKVSDAEPSTEHA